MSEPVDKQNKSNAASPQPSQSQEELIPQQHANADIFRQFSAAASPPPMKPNTVLMLQSTIGNAATRRLLSESAPSPLQRSPIIPSRHLSNRIQRDIKVGKQPIHPRMPSSLLRI